MQAIAQQKQQDYIAFILSIVVHTALLLVFYYDSLQQGKWKSLPAYSITWIKPAAPQQATLNNNATPNTSSPLKENVAIQDQKDTHQLTPSPHHTLHTDTTPDTTPAIDAMQQPLLDERALYSIPSTKPAASLELPGWTWDRLPHIKDQTDEVGTLVFEIIIDDMGEIIAIKTIEKTVSPLVEQFYKDEIAKLTFSKTSKNAPYQPTYTGKITFILQYKPTASKEANS
jgi:hypothetical protein